MLSIYLVLSLSRALSLSRSLARARALTLSLSRACALARTLSLARSLAPTRALALSLARALSRSLARALSLSLEGGSRSSGGILRWSTFPRRGLGWRWCLGGWVVSLESEVGINHAFLEIPNTSSTGQMKSLWLRKHLPLKWFFFLDERKTPQTSSTGQTKSLLSLEVSSFEMVFPPPGE